MWEARGPESSARGDEGGQRQAEATPAKSHGKGQGRGSQGYCEGGSPGT